VSRRPGSQKLLTFLWPPAHPFCMNLWGYDRLRPDAASAVKGSDVGGATRSASLAVRLRAVRNRRRASRLSGATALVAWIAGLAAILVMVGGSVLNLR
jgi:hypothetical protein